MLTTQRVTTPRDIEAVAVLAHEVWDQHFVPIIGQEQVDYMLDKCQRVGFAIAGPIVTDIGGGFVMDDYRMVKSVVD